MKYYIEPLILKGLCHRHQIDIKGIVQVGAHVGQEVDEFLTVGPEKILMIEALPNLAKSLAIKYQNIPRIKVVSCAISNYNGVTNFNVLSNGGMSSSILPPNRQAWIWPSIVKTGEVRLPCKRLDSLMEELDEKPFDYNFLMVDVQGAEHLVFEGAAELLKHIEAVHTEVNYIELYEGCVMEKDLTGFLRGNGFEKKEEVKNEVWGDAFYVRVDGLQ